MKVTKQSKQAASIIANMVAATVGAPAPASTVDPKVAEAIKATADKVVAVTKAQKIEKPAAKTPVKAVSKTQAKKAAKPTPAVKKAAKAGAKVAIEKAQKSAKTYGEGVVKSDKQGLTYGQWLKLLQNTAAQREVKIPATQAGLDKKFQPLYMKGAKIGEALGA